MNTKLTLFAPEDIADYVAMLREWRLNRASSSRDVQRRLVTSQTPIYVRNSNAAAIPPYACMQATGTEEDTETGQNYIVVDQPVDVTGTAGAYLFNGPEQIEIDGDGIAQNSRVVRAIKDTGTATAGASWQPIVSSWEIAAGGNAFVMIGDDDIVADCVRVFYAGGMGSGGAKLVQATSGIAARSSTSLGSAICTEYKITGTTLETNTETIEVLNLSLLAIPVDAYLIAVLEQISNKWIAQAIINGLRFEAPNLLQLRVGDNSVDWVTWHEAGFECPEEAP